VVFCYGTTLAPRIGMSRIPSRSIAAALCFIAIPAHADFYRLDGRFECLAHPEALCFDKSEAPPDPYEQHAVVPSGSPLAQPTVRPPPPVALEMPRAPNRPPDPVLIIAARIRHGHPDAGDVAVLRRAAEANDPRAVEVLAWCLLRGIGAERDAYQAYLLYGKAAELSVPLAQENQRLVFERSLSSNERERILELEAAQHLPPSPLSDADGAPRHVP
jgi:hypothetical protein